MIAKEACTKRACCHASSYQVCKLPANEKLPNLTLNCNTDEGFPNILKHLSNLFYNPETRKFKNIQGLAETLSAKKLETNKAKTD